MGSSVFLRDATGLVRALTAFDMFIASLSIVSLGGAAGATMVLLGLYPGADLVGVFTIGLIPTIAFVVVYSIMTAAFPRSGGEYIWVSRIAGPTLGFTYGWMMQFSFLFFILAGQAWFITWVGLPSTLSGLGLILKQNYLMQWSNTITSSASLSFFIAAVVLVLGGLFCVFGVGVYAKISAPYGPMR